MRIAWPIRGGARALTRFCWFSPLSPPDPLSPLSPQEPAGYAHPKPIFRCSPWNIGPDGTL